MPDRMVEGEFFPSVKNHANAVSQAASEHQDESAGLHIVPDRLGGDDGHPAHAKVDRGADLVKTAREEQFEDHADQSQAPHHTKQAPSPDRRQHQQSHRRIRPRDEDVDRRMVHDAAHMFELRVEDGVVDRRRRKQKNHARAEDVDRDEVDRRSVQARLDHQVDQPHDAEQQGKTVRQAVGQLFIRRLKVFRFGGCFLGGHSDKICVRSSGKLGRCGAEKQAHNL